MRFTLKKRPSEGDRRIVQYFAVFPVTIGRDRRWLEWVKIRQRYCKPRKHFIGVPSSWENDAFID